MTNAQAVTCDDLADKAWRGLMAPSIARPRCPLYVRCPLVPRDDALL